MYLIYPLQIFEGAEPRVSLHPIGGVHELLRSVHEVDDVLWRALCTRIVEVLVASQRMYYASLVGSANLTCPLSDPYWSLERIVEVFEVLDERCGVDVVPMHRDEVNCASALASIQPVEQPLLP